MDVWCGGNVSSVVGIWKLPQILSILQSVGTVLAWSTFEISYILAVVYTFSLMSHALSVALVARPVDDHETELVPAEGKTLALALSWNFSTDKATRQVTSDSSVHVLFHSKWGHMCPPAVTILFRIKATKCDKIIYLKGSLIRCNACWLEFFSLSLTLILYLGDDGGVAWPNPISGFRRWKCGSNWREFWANISTTVCRQPSGVQWNHPELSTVEMQFLSTVSPPAMAG